MTRFTLRQFFSFSVCLSALAVSATASATSYETVRAQSCTVIPEAIIPLKPPNFGGPAEWRKVLGMEGLDKISDMMALADGGVIAVGESISYSRTDGSKPPQMYVTRLDKAGKVLFEKRLAIKNFSDVAAAVVLKDKVVVVSQLVDDKKASSVQIDFLDGGASIKDTHVLFDPQKDMIAADIITNSDGATLTLAVMLVDRKDKADTTTVIYRIDAAGKILAKRDYLPGTGTRIFQLQRLPRGQIVGAGRIAMGDNRQAGWVLLISAQGDLVSQQPYARGTQSQLTRALDDGQGGLYVAGEAIPSDGSYRAAWVMHLDAAGNPVWQRFISGKYRYGAVDMIRAADGRIQLLMAGRPVEDGGREHARIITLSPVGDILQDEAYLEGTNALPSRLLEHSITKRRFLAGMAQTGFVAPGTPDAQKAATYDAWLAGLPILPMYTDPCKPARTETLDDQ